MPSTELSGLDEIIWTELPPHNRIESSIGRNWPSRSGCPQMSWGSGLFIEDTSQSDSGWWPPVCHFAWLRTHARRHLVLHMSGCMSRTHAGRHHSSHMSGCMARTHARRHPSTHMSISMLRLHARRHLVLGRSTSCFYVSGCMDCFHARRHLLLRHLELLGRFTRFLTLLAYFRPAINPEYFSASGFRPISGFPVVLRSRHACFPSKLRAEETSFFTNVELLNRRASKNVMLPKHPSHQSKTSSNYGRATYSTHS
ncbi:hypothetical protein IGI04_036360 [Brassica rapa subsp. trilocularis]|uniref:Uncharacterized protein n=1 Tax=Brassica rapa subsp. trilocularis TaxID=1813537 RepID=A0ABQ7LG22_BRACM|nr:hypothetical protein IGI04_036360 [Brassica rapa subsp. trilocularis]